MTENKIYNSMKEIRKSIDLLMEYSAVNANSIENVAENQYENVVYSNNCEKAVVYNND